MKSSLCAFVAMVVIGANMSADGPGDNIVDKVRRVPPPGIEVPAADQQELSDGIARLGKAIAELRISLKGKAALLELLPDVQIYHNAVRYALNHNEIYKGEIPVAKKLLQQGLERAAQLGKGETPWT